MPGIKVTYPVENDSPIHPNNPKSVMGDPGYRNNYKAAEVLMNVAAGRSKSSANPAMRGMVNKTEDSTGDVSNAFGELTSGDSNTNPLGQLIMTGYIMLIVAQYLYIGVLILTIVMAIVMNLNIMIVGSGMTKNPAGSMMMFLYIFIMPLFFMFLGLLTSVGATMAIYVPLIPYIIFTMGAIGWLFSTIEAMVAGPLVALGILSPSGQHELLGKAEPAIMMLFTIFLRPSLMIFGLMAAMLLSAVVVSMINTGFGTVVRNLFDFEGTGELGGQAAAGANPLAMIFILVAYVTLIITALNKCFATIHMLPVRVMAWIGHRAEGYGEEQAAGEVQAAVGGAAGKMTAGAKEGADKGAGQHARDSQKKSPGGSVTSTKKTPPKKGG